MTEAILNSNARVEEEIWFRGMHTENSDGSRCYFICSKLLSVFDELTGAYKNSICSISSDPTKECTTDCENFANCAECTGFSAVRCQECNFVK